MKNKILLLGILGVLTMLIWALTSGIFTSRPDDYASVKTPDIIDYNFHIKPLLSDNCYKCHGPDANKRKAGLRLDIETDAF